MNSRTNFRLQLQREQSIQEQRKIQSSFINNNTNTSLNSNLSSNSQQQGNNVEMTDDTSPSARISSPVSTPGRQMTSPMAIRVSANNTSTNSNAVQAPKTLPVIISQPIRFSGNRLVHLPPQIIHVQQQSQNFDDMGRKNLTLSSSLPPGFIQSPLAKTPKVDCTNHVGTPQQAFFPHQVLSGSKQSSAELSPAGYADSPRSASFASAQSELDDVIIDEILSMEEEQQRRKQLRTLSHQATSPDKLANSLSYADDLEGLLNSDRTGSVSASSSYQRQVSNSAPTTTVDIEGLVRDELIREQESMRDRRKKDVHNMIERRRRYNINDRIKELGSLLPKSCTEEMKLNKGTILQASVEYILALRKDQERLIQVQQKQQVLEVENRRMVQRIQDLEERLKATGAEVPPKEETKPIVFATDRVIKTEPTDDVIDVSAPQMVHGRQQQNASYVGQASPYQPHLHTMTASNEQHQHADYSPSLSGHSYAQQQISNTNEEQQQNVAFYTNAAMTGGGDYDPRMVLPGSSLGSIMSNRPSNGIQLVPVSLVQQSQMRSNNNNVTSAHHMQDLIMELGGECGGPSPGLMSTADPMMSDTRLLNSHVSSPDINWDSATFSPDANEHMDFVSS